MNGKKRSIFTWSRIKKTEAELLQDEAKDEASLLERDILEKELALIDAKHKIMAQKAKRLFIGNWMSRPTVSGSPSAAEVRDIIEREIQRGTA